MLYLARDYQHMYMYDAPRGGFKCDELWDNDTLIDSHMVTHGFAKIVDAYACQDTEHLVSDIIRSDFVFVFHVFQYEDIEIQN